MKIKISALTDVGKERTNNEDALIYCSDLSLQKWSAECQKEYVKLGDLGTLLVVTPLSVVVLLGVGDELL